MAAPAPAITITSFVNAVEVGKPALAVAKLTGGPATMIEWLWRPSGSGYWIVAATNPASDLDQHFVWFAPGAYDIAVQVKGPGGSNQTGAKRTVMVTPAPAPAPEPEPAPDPEPAPVPVPTPPPAPAPQKPQSVWTSLRKLNFRKVLKALGI
jgi:hypothetical protein